MCLKANVNVCRKVSDNNYGSYGASVSLEVELDAGLLSNPAQFQARVREVYALANQALADEMARQAAQPAARPAAQPPAQPPAAGRAATHRESQAAQPDHPAPQRRNGRAASEKQIGYAHVLARSIEGLGAGKLGSLVYKVYHTTIDALTAAQATKLIETLKAVGAGELSLSQALAS
jgi:hypothetical protein